MADGYGTRSRALTSYQLRRPKISIANVPCMERIVLLLGSHGFDDITVTLQFMLEEIQDYFGDGSTYGTEGVIKSE